MDINIIGKEYVGINTSEERYRFNKFIANNIDIQMSTQLPSTKATEEEISPFDDESFNSTFIKDNPCFETLQQIQHTAIKSWERQTSERTNIF